MIKKFFLSIIFFALPTLVLAQPITTHQLINYCKVALDVFDKNFGYVQTDSEYLQGIKTGICEGYILSVCEKSSLSQKSYCSGCDMPVAIAIVVKYAKDHPQQMQLKPSELVKKALAR